MNDEQDEKETMTCEQARATLHELLDGDSVDREQEYRDHIAACSGCREADRDLQTIQTELRALPLAALPDTALERVWRDTTRPKGRQVSRRRFRGMDWRPAAAAAALAAVLLGVHFVGPPDPSEAELNQAAVEARMVLQLTARALRQSEETVIREVLAKEVSPALGRAPIPQHAKDGSP